MRCIRLLWAFQEPVEPAFLVSFIAITPLSFPTAKMQGFPGFQHTDVGPPFKVVSTGKMEHNNLSFKKIT